MNVEIRKALEDPSIQELVTGILKSLGIEDTGTVNANLFQKMSGQFYSISTAIKGKTGPIPPKVVSFVGNLLSRYAKEPKYYELLIKALSEVFGVSILVKHNSSIGRTAAFDAVRAKIAHDFNLSATDMAELGAPPPEIRSSKRSAAPLPGTEFDFVRGDTVLRPVEPVSETESLKGFREVPVPTSKEVKQASSGIGVGVNDDDSDEADENVQEETGTAKPAEIAPPAVEDLLVMSHKKDPHKEATVMALRDELFMSKLVDVQFYRKLCNGLSERIRTFQVRNTKLGPLMGFPNSSLCNGLRDISGKFQNPRSLHWAIVLVIMEHVYGKGIQGEVKQARVDEIMAHLEKLAAQENPIAAKPEEKPIPKKKEEPVLGKGDSSKELAENVSQQSTPPLIINRQPICDNIMADLGLTDVQGIEVCLKAISSLRTVLTRHYMSGAEGNIRICPASDPLISVIYDLSDCVEAQIPFEVEALETHCSFVLTGAIHKVVIEHVYHVGLARKEKQTRTKRLSEEISEMQSKLEEIFAQKSVATEGSLPAKEEQDPLRPPAAFASDEPLKESVDAMMQELKAIIGCETELMFPDYLLLASNNILKRLLERHYVAKRCGAPNGSTLLILEEICGLTFPATTSTEKFEAAFRLLFRNHIRTMEFKPGSKDRERLHQEVRNGVKFLRELSVPEGTPDSISGKALQAAFSDKSKKAKSNGRTAVPVEKLLNETFRPDRRLDAVVQSVLEAIAEKSGTLSERLFSALFYQYRLPVQQSLHPSERLLGLLERAEAAIDSERLQAIIVLIVREHVYGIGDEVDKGVRYERFDKIYEHVLSEILRTELKKELMDSAEKQQVDSSSSTAQEADITALPEPDHKDGSAENQEHLSVFRCNQCGTFVRKDKAQVLKVPVKSETDDLTEESLFVCPKGCAVLPKIAEMEVSEGCFNP